MKFKIGDPVWVYTTGEIKLHIYTGEYPAIITGICNGLRKGTAPEKWKHLICTHSSLAEGYLLEVFEIPCPGGIGWCANEHSLRPRRDDYQQHEPLGHRDQLNKPIELPLKPTVASLEQALIEIMELCESTGIKIHRS